MSTISATVESCPGGGDRKENKQPLESAECSEKDKHVMMEVVESDAAPTTVKRKALDEVDKVDGDSVENNSPNSSFSSEQTNGEIPREKKVRKDPEVNPYKPKSSIHQLKRDGSSFVQYRRCVDVIKHSPNIPQCRECKYFLPEGSVGKSLEKCRFYGFRKLGYRRRKLTCKGFCDPTADPTEAEMNLWLPSSTPLENGKDPDTSKFILDLVGNQFCELVREENKTFGYNQGRKVAWKRAVDSVREMCDVCYTTLFNYQWTCDKCGFVACSDCYNARREGKAKASYSQDPERDECSWLICVTLKGHELDGLMLTQVIAGGALNKLWQLLHQVRHENDIAQNCGCSEAEKYKFAAKTVPATIKNIQDSKVASEQSVVKQEDISTVCNGKKQICEDSETSDDSDCDDGAVGLREFFAAGLQDHEPSSTVSEAEADSLKAEDSTQKFYSPHAMAESLVRPLPLAKTLAETSILYPNVPHSWLCSGKLLRLFNPTNPDNYELFKDVWKRGQPVLVSKVDTQLTKSLWTPQAFSQDFGRKTTDFINCMTGKSVLKQRMKVFWEGFEYIQKRLRDEKGNPMLLKLKDWPPTADFADVLPERFADLMKALPLQDYTSRDGRYNLTTSLPNTFVKPDLGPKMYVAYGCGLHLEKGTTNLHLDVSDAVNVMVYVGEPKDCKDSDNIVHRQAVMQAIEESDCDNNTIQRITVGGEVPGALWHIYDARDADKIRSFLNQTVVQRGERLEDYHDPIHDQRWYLDKKLRTDLMTNFNVVGYPIIQCAGDAVFIPAGAPHQVRNLQNCIKIAEDFVSPENVHHCFHLTEEFRRLSEWHTNHEDKLQIKNIVYHAVKDAISVLLNDYKHTAKEV